MARYHLNPKTGNPGPCSAKIKCPFGDINEDHWSSKEEARSAYEERSASGSMPKVKRSKASLNAALREFDAKIGQLKDREGALQSEKVKLEKIVRGFKPASESFEALRKTYESSPEELARLEKLETDVRREYRRAHERLSTIDKERPAISRDLNTFKKSRDSVSSELASSFPPPPRTKIPLQRPNLNS